MGWKQQHPPPSSFSSFFFFFAPQSTAGNIKQFRRGCLNRVPNQQGCCAKWKLSWNTYTLHTRLVARLEPICNDQALLINKIFASGLSRKFLLRVRCCWLGRRRKEGWLADVESDVKDPHIAPPPSPPPLPPPKLTFHGHGMAVASTINFRAHGPNPAPHRSLPKIGSVKSGRLKNSGPKKKKIALSMRFGKHCLNVETSARKFVRPFVALGLQTLLSFAYCTCSSGSSNGSSSSNNNSIDQDPELPPSSPPPPALVIRKNIF